MDENSQETRSIEDLMKMIDAGKLVLPEFQREFKWPIEKTVTLFDSINRNSTKTNRTQCSRNF